MTLWRRHRRVGLLAVVLALTMLISPLQTAAGSNDPGGAAPDADPRGKIDAEVLQGFEAAGARSAEPVSYWLVLGDVADLTPAYGIEDWAERGQFVFDRLRQVAAESQGEVIEVLTDAGVAHDPFWIVNTVKVTGGDEDLLMDLASVPDVSAVLADRPLELIEPEPAAEIALVDEVEWGIANIRAHSVWEEFDVWGEDVVVGVIDTGTRHTHEALVEQYRGNLGDGTFEHDHNWFDPYGECPNPSVPCDNHGHGTHVTGTAVGWDGADNRIGVAPRAEWIAAKGCTGQGRCLIDNVLLAGQFMLAPTRTDGYEPRPDLRPHVVNNSWGASIEDDLYQQMVVAWVAAGIFPAFANGNSGPGCGTVGRPAMYPEAYGVGAHNVNNNLANFSSRGPAPAPWDVIKPNITAPGVSVRSARPGSTSAYGNSSGTSMASPHLAGAVALLWSAEPALLGNIDVTREILGRTATPVSNLTCGGTPDDNNLWGQGRLDIFAAVQDALEPVIPFELRVNVGGGEYVDAGGEVWAADRAFGQGDGDLDWGYVSATGTSRPRTTEAGIDGTDDPVLYQSQRENLSEYRVEVPQPGLYEITLHLAELQHDGVGRRLFSIGLEGGPDTRQANRSAVEALREDPSDVEAALAVLQSAGLTNYDIYATVGRHTADVHTARVYVDDGELNVTFHAPVTQYRPVLNAITVTSRAPWQN